MKLVVEKWVRTRHTPSVRLPLHSGESECRTNTGSGRDRSLATMPPLPSRGRGDPPLTNDEMAASLSWHDKARSLAVRGLQPVARLFSYLFSYLPTAVNRQAHDVAMGLASSPPNDGGDYDEAVVSRDIVIPSHVDGHLNSARIYHPPRRTTTGGSRPLVVFYHGGGWCMLSGTLRPYHLFLEAMCRQLDVYILSCEYRLAPEHPYPTPAEDCYSALPWLASDASNGIGSVGGVPAVPLEADRSRIVVMGDSAGGNLASVVAMMHRDRCSVVSGGKGAEVGNITENEGKAGAASPPGPAVPVRVAHQVLIYPCYCKRPLTLSRLDPRMPEPVLPKAMMLWFETMYAPEGVSLEDMSRDPYVCCESADSLLGLPPLTGILAGLDILRDEGHSYFTAVAAAVAEAEEAGETGEAGNNLEHVDWRCWNSACHGFITPASPFSEPCSSALTQEVLAYVATRLAPLGVTFTGSARSKL